MEVTQLPAMTSVGSRPHASVTVYLHVLIRLSLILVKRRQPTNTPPHKVKEIDAWTLSII